MQGKAALIAVAVVLNCGISVFADASSQSCDMTDLSIESSVMPNSTICEFDDGAVVTESEECVITQESMEEDAVESQWVGECEITEECIDVDAIECNPEYTTEEGTLETTETPSEEYSEEIILEETNEETVAETSAEESAEKTSELQTETDTEEDVESKTAEVLSEEIQIYNVSLPAKTIAYLDPGNLSGRGQIFSDQYIVENHGNTDIAIKIKNIDIICHSAETVYEFSQEEIIDNQSTVKKLNISMIWRNEYENMEKTLNVTEGAPQEYVLLLKAAAYDEKNEYIGLNEGSTGSFCFTGTLNANADIVWGDGDISACFDYEIVQADKNIKNSFEPIEEPETMTDDINTNTEESSESEGELETMTDQNSEETISTEAAMLDTDNVNWE